MRPHMAQIATKNSAVTFFRLPKVWAIRLMTKQLVNGHFGVFINAAKEIYWLDNITTIIVIVL